MTDQTNAPSVVEQAAAAVVSTIASPDPVTIVSDLMLAIELVNEFKAKISGMHPSITNVIKALF